MNQSEYKSSSLMEYRQALESAFQKGHITAANRLSIDAKGKGLGLTSEEEKTLQVMVLGAPISELVSKTNPGNAVPPPPVQADTNPSDAGMPIGGIVFLVAIIIGALALFVFFPPSWPVIVGICIVGLIKSFLAG